MPSEAEPATAPSSFTPRAQEDRIAALYHELDYLNMIGKRFVAAIDRFQVHQALLAALQELYSFSACAILLKSDPPDLSIIPAYALSEAFLQTMIQRIARAARVVDFPAMAVQELAIMSYLDAPDEFAQCHAASKFSGDEIGSCLNIPLTVENRIIGLLSLFDEKAGAFDTKLLKLTTMIADYAAVALENVRLRERETALWRQAELERQRLELVIQSMAEGLLITNASGIITSLNSSAQHLLSHAQVNLQSEQPLRELASTEAPNWVGRLAHFFDQALSGITMKNQELVAGESSEIVPLTLSVSASPLYDTSQPQERCIGVVAILNDITSIRQIEQLKDEFVSVVSHELRTPLTTIKGYTQHLARRIERRVRAVREEQGIALADLPESIDLRNLAIMESQCDRLERVVNDLLDLPRVQLGTLPLQLKEFFLADVLAEAVRLAQVSAEGHSISLELLTQETRVVADKHRLSMVIGNILDNAIKYSPYGGPVRVQLTEQEDHLLVSVRDEGLGVKSEYLEHIFDRFYRVHNAASKYYSGIGLGLYVSKAIVEGHGGHIWVHNNEDHGCTFSFTIQRSPQAL